VSDPLHVALIAKLKTLVDVPVWDAVPQGSDYPYVTLDYTQESNDPYLTLRVKTRFVYLAIWSRAYGQAEILEIINQIDGIHEQPLTMSSGQVVSVRIERTRTVRETDNLTFQGQVTLRIITQQ